ncbi:hypothetical protein M409DRAFT_49653 [Zasmidium cellare ATCC 36951]|uniref:Uncharacterized protein n=1 Tax=Zasmidium cellare ATCC 36951 TaxID=1080233 RepID=A0A6A6D1D5_ZASCE|nr:uncharacterized protein M409DRAFT_49653 [Zasmidium cellare ATCC 36951]KAF2173171.1 hypothetical protein M409DRAFT_49653 [Zasmidium cellare ATCC 36951]
MGHINTTEPTQWSDERRNPAIDFGLFAFPAYVLPVLVASIFVWIKPHCRFLQRLNRNPAQLGPGVLNGVRNDRAGDFPRQIQGLLALFHVFCTGPALTQDNKSYKDDLFGYGSAEALSLLIGAFYLDPAMLTSYLATSTGWILLAINKRFSSAAMLLSLPCAWQITGYTGIYHWHSGILLFRLASDYIELDLVDHVRENVTYYLKSWNQAFYITCIIIGATINLVRSAARRESLQEAVDTILAGLYDACLQVVRAIVHLAAFLGPVALNAAITGFLATCIGWRWIVVGKPANSPFSSPLAMCLWALFYLVLWCLVQFLTEKRDRQRRQDVVDTFLYEMVICADVTGLAAALMVLLWWTIVVLLHTKILV